MRPQTYHTVRFKGWEIAKHKEEKWVGRNRRAIGASGSTAENDHAVAQAGADAL